MSYRVGPNKPDPYALFACIVIFYACLGAFDEIICEIHNTKGFIKNGIIFLLIGISCEVLFHLLPQEEMFCEVSTTHRYITGGKILYVGAEDAELIAFIFTVEWLCLLLAVLTLLRFCQYNGYIREWY